MFLCACGPQDHVGFPPTDKTVVKTDMEDIKEQLNKASWIEAIHSCAPHSNWREIEAKNSYLSYKQQSQQRTKSRVTIANTITGEWEERGSNNQAGSILRTAYDSREQRLYALADGGSIWSGNAYNIRVGENLDWSVFEDNLRFTKRFLEVVYPTEDNTRLIAAIAGIPHYKNGVGLWQKADGFGEVNSLVQIKNQICINDGKDILFLAKKKHNEKVRLYHSDDHGYSYTMIREFNTYEIEDIAIDGYKEEDSYYLIEKASPHRCKIWRGNNSSLQLLTADSPVGLSSYGYANIKASQSDLYVIDGNNNLKKSSNAGASWQQMASLPPDTYTWKGGLFISKADPNTMIVCGVNALISKDAGRNWSKINDWEEYYADVQHKLHADIMHIEEYDAGDYSMIAICNHGGISTSIDGGEIFNNIATYGLNVSQYYSVKTYPRDNNYIFAGSQDQGIQRTFLIEEGESYFDQTFSGDFGHLEYTNEGKSLWAVFPGGEIIYYDNPLLQREPKHTFSLESFSQIWLPPIASNPNVQDGIIMGGGSILRNQSGSFLIRREVEGNIARPPVQLPYNFAIHGGYISDIAYHPNNPNIIYVITSNGKFFISEDAGGNFRLSESGLTEANYLYGHKILCSDIDPDVIYISGSGYDNAPVYISEDGGQSFSPFAEGLPATTVFDMDMTSAENFIYAATAAGPYVYIRKLGEWYPMTKSNAPNQEYWSVEVLDDQIVRYGTFGRGIWDFDILSIVSSEDQIKEDITIYPNPTTDFIRVNNTDKSSAKIINNRGQVIKTITSLVPSERIDISHFDAGVYYIIFDGELRASNRFIKI